MFNEEEFDKFSHTCSNCKNAVMNPFKEKGVIFNTWEDKKISYCKHCANEVFDELESKYMVEKSTDGTIYKAMNRYWIRLFGSLSFDALNDAKVFICRENKLIIDEFKYPNEV